MDGFLGGCRVPEPEQARHRARRAAVGSFGSVAIAVDLAASLRDALYEFRVRVLQPAEQPEPTPAVRVRTIAPSPALAPYVRRFEIVETSAPMSKTLLPETGLILGVRYSGASTVDGSAAPLGPAVLTGLRVKARRMATSSGGGVVVAKFTETGAAALLDLPLHRLFGATVPLEELLPAPDVERLVEEVRQASDTGQRIEAVERFVSSRLRPHDDPLVAETTRMLSESDGTARIGAMARALGVSQDVLEKRFRRRVGATPKQFASILRFRRAVASHRPEGDLGRLALEAGYYDQAHFNRQFRSITGSAPGALFNSAEYCRSGANGGCRESEP
jgi:methylphosphotriester-DNA--protein-cysteine methyltransferase